VVLLASCVGAACGATTTEHAPPRLFASTSVWNAPVGHSAVDRSSKRRMGALVTEVRREIRSGTGPWISDVEASTPFYVVPRHARRVFVKLDTGSWGAQLQEALARGVPIPLGAFRPGYDEGVKYPGLEETCSMTPPQLACQPSRL